MRWLVTLLLLLTGPARAADAPVLVELFTSQGCSSCPPADRALSRLATRADVLPLSFHVAYWNYIGWKDTFATEATTARQYAYGRTLGHGRVYTPQAVVGGTHDVVGSDSSALERTIERMRQAPRIAVAFEAEAVRVGAGDAAPASLWLACYDDRHEVLVARGENGGRRLGYSNVVRHLEKLGDWRGAAARFDAPIATQRAAGRSACAAILQQAEAGPVLGLAQVRLAESR